jgi:hypothetical protein
MSSLKITRLSKRTVLIIVISQLVLVGVIGVVVVANAVNSAEQTSTEGSPTPKPEITGSLLVATPIPSPAAIETSAPDPAPDSGVAPYVPPLASGTGDGCRVAMDAIRATVDALYENSNSLYIQRQNFTAEGMTPEEAQAAIDDLTRQIDGVQAQVAAYFAGLGIDPSKGYGCGGDNLPAN